MDRSAMRMCGKQVATMLLSGLAGGLVGMYAVGAMVDHRASSSHDDQTFPGLIPGILLGAPIGMITGVFLGYTLGPRCGT